MGKKRRRIRNDGQVRQTATRQVVARPVNTTVAPGAQGMPVQPDPIPLPTPPQETDINVAEMAAQRDARNAIQESQRLIQGFGSLSAGLNQLAQGSVKLGVTMKSQEELTLEYQIKEREEILAQLAIDNLSFAEREQQGLIPPNANPNYMRAMAEYETQRSVQSMEDWYYENRAKIESDPRHDTMSGFQDTFNQVFDEKLEAIPESGDRAWYQMKMGGLRAGIWNSLKKPHSQHIARVHKEKERSFITSTSLRIVNDAVRQTEVDDGDIETILARAHEAYESYVVDGWASSRTPAYMQAAYGKSLVDIMVKTDDPDQFAMAKQLYDSLPSGASPNALVKNISEVETYELDNRLRISANEQRLANGISTGKFKADTNLIKDGVQQAFNQRIDSKFTMGTKGLGPIVEGDIETAVLNVAVPTFNDLASDRKFIESLVPEGYSIGSVDEDGVVVVTSLDENLVGRTNSFNINLKNAYERAKSDAADKWTQAIEGFSRNAEGELTPAMRASAKASSDKLFNVTPKRLIDDLNNLDRLMSPESFEQNPEEVTEKFNNYYTQWKAYRDEGYPLDIDDNVENTFEAYEYLLYDFDVGQGSEAEALAIRTIVDSSERMLREGVDLRSNIKQAFSDIYKSASEVTYADLGTVELLSGLSDENEDRIIEIATRRLAAGINSTSEGAIRAAVSSFRGNSVQLGPERVHTRDLVKKGYVSKESQLNLQKIVGTKAGEGIGSSMFSVGLHQPTPDGYSFAVTGRPLKEHSPENQKKIIEATKLVGSYNEKYIYPVMGQAAGFENAEGLTFKIGRDGSFEPQVIQRTGNKPEDVSLIPLNVDPISPEEMSVMYSIWINHMDKWDTTSKVTAQIAYTGSALTQRRSIQEKMMAIPETPGTFLYRVKQARITREVQEGLDWINSLDSGRMLESIRIPTTEDLEKLDSPFFKPDFTELDDLDTDSLIRELIRP